MHDVADSLLIQCVLVILASTCGVAVFTYWRLPAVIGYLLAGLAIGPYGLKLISAGEAAQFLAELGLIFLMFMVGLEFSLPMLIAARKEVVGLGSLQVGVTALAIMICIRLLGGDWPTAIVLGGAVAMSSTAISYKQLAEQGEISSQHGRLALGILLFQDVATLPFLVMLSAWAENSQSSFMGVTQRVVIAALVLGAAALIARPLFRAALPWVSRAKSQDLLLLCVLLITLGTGFIVNQAGLAAPSGAFLAGMVIGESDFRHQVEDDIRPFRDTLVGLFFVTIGMGINPSIIATHPVQMLIWVFVFLCGKALLTFFILVTLHWPLSTSLRTAVILAHGGEFGLLLLTEAMAGGILDDRTGQPILVALIGTMGIAPLLVQNNARLAQLLGLVGHRMAATEAAIREVSAQLDNHVVVGGYGRVGRLIVTVLDTAKISYIAIETDIARFREAKQRGHRVVFGDAGRRRILDAAGLSRAQLIIVTFDRRRVVERILHAAHQKNPTIPTMVNAADDRDVAWLAKAGASVVFPENFAVGLGLADQALMLCGLNQEEAARIITTVRAQLNPELRARVGI